jgi:hypothetical protein
VKRGEGSCLCGAVRYSIALPPLWVAHCHCSMCRRAHGAGFVTWAGADGEQFAFVGNAETLQTYASSAEARRSFCGRCGTPLFFESSRWPGEVHVTVASLAPEVAATLQPQAHVHWADRVAWIHVGDDGLPRREATGTDS